ncbi:Centrosomal protein [Echinococcus granulosus]|uniref:Centrosomal protein n=2 Tax=Echinococcus granulosus TaxID=6210 RepID=W6USR6_ECHGR|nr:Centrosomal protein [Echinococcus granulosus]EUB64343.1 Centrosomal protein [Echinococcus granulosus]
MCASVLPISSHPISADDEDNEDVRLQSELDRLIKDEFDATDFDIRFGADESLSPHSTQQNGSTKEFSFESRGRDPSFTHDLLDAGESDVESVYHPESQTPVSQIRLPESSQTSLPIIQQISCESHRSAQQNYHFFYQQYPFTPHSGVHTVMPQGVAKQNGVSSRQLYDPLLQPHCDEVTAVNTTNSLLKDPVPNQFYCNSISQQPALSTPNLCIRTGEGFSATQVEQHARSCTPIPSNSSTPHQSSNFLLNAFLRPVLSPQPDENASPARLSPIQSYRCDMNIGVPPISTPGELEIKAQLDEKNRECLIFEARGRQLREAQQQIGFLKEEIAQCERVSHRKEILAKAEIENLTRELERTEVLKNAAEKRNAEMTETNSNLINEITAMKHLKAEVERKLADCEATNASLSAQLVQLSSGASLSLAKQRENNLTECLTRRHAMAEDVLRENLEMAQRKIVDKDNELVSLRKDLESERLRIQELATKNAEFVESLQDKLKAAQDRCSELSSSSLCVEIHELRQRIKEVLTSKKITDDINEILQEELRDVREQLSLYEQTLGIDAVGEVEAEFLAVDDSGAVTPRHQLPLFHDTGGAVLSTIITKPSPGRCRRRSCQSVTFATHLENCQDGDALDLARMRRPSSAIAAPLSSTWNHEIGTTTAVAAAVSDDEVISTTPSRRSALDPTPGVSHPTTHEHTKNSSSKAKDSIISLTLSSYRAKRAQITDLHEKLFAARRDLHKAAAERDRAEAARADLQLRVLALEKELNLQEDVRKPGPRESALTGQLERLQTDYFRLESELQMARSRLQDALAAEARAAAAERTARERLDASTAEREAAVERARAACEAHYTAARRRLEAQLNTEHERILLQLRQEVLLAREETTAYRNELENVNKLLQESKDATAYAVQLALTESMKERESERIRFWREELPRQIEQVRRSWICDAEVRTALEANRVRSSCQVEFETRMAACQREHQAELERLRRPKSTCDRAVSCTYVTPTHALSAHGCPLLTTLIPDDLFAQLASIPEVANLLPLIEGNLGPLLRNVTQALVQQVSDATTKSLLEAISEFDVLKDYQIQLTEKLSLEDPHNSVVEAVLNMLANLVSTDLSTEIAIMRKLAGGFAEFSKITTELRYQNKESSAVPGGVISKIRGEVRTYVESCQERYAMALQTGLVRAHRRACRQLSLSLRTALSESGLSLLSAARGSVHTSPKYSTMGLSESQLESLLHIIDGVCASAEMLFSETSLKGLQVFSPPSHIHAYHRETRPSDTSPSATNDHLTDAEDKANMPLALEIRPSTLTRGSNGVQSSPRQSSPEVPVPTPRSRLPR